METWISLRGCSLPQTRLHPGRLRLRTRCNSGSFAAETLCTLGSALPNPALGRGAARFLQWPRYLITMVHPLNHNQVAKPLQLSGTLPPSGAVWGRSAQSSGCASGAAPQGRSSGGARPLGSLYVFWGDFISLNELTRSRSPTTPKPLGVRCFPVSCRFSAKQKNKHPIEHLQHVPPPSRSRYPPILVVPRP